MNEAETGLENIAQFDADPRETLVEDIRALLVHEADHYQRKIHEAEQEALLPNADLHAISRRIRCIQDKISELDEENQKIDSLSMQELERLRDQLVAKRNANEVEYSQIAKEAEQVPIDLDTVEELETIRSARRVRPTKSWLEHLGEQVISFSL